MDMSAYFQQLNECIGKCFGIEPPPSPTQQVVAFIEGAIQHNCIASARIVDLQCTARSGDEADLGVVKSCLDTELEKLHAALAVLKEHRVKIDSDAGVPVHAVEARMDEEENHV